MFDKTLLSLTKPVISQLAIITIKVGLSANSASIIGFILGVTAACLVSLGYFFFVLIFFILNRIFDGIDGAIAREQNPTHLGAFLDIIFDFIVYSSQSLIKGVQNLFGLNLKEILKDIESLRVKIFVTRRQTCLLVMISMSLKISLKF